MLGQFRQIVELDFEMPDFTEATDRDVLNVLLSKVPVAKMVAILLHPTEYHIMEKDIDVIQKEVEFELTATQIEEMVTDFFVQCPLEQVLVQVNKIAKVSQSLLPMI